jgi:hypothetical protein
LIAVSGSGGGAGKLQVAREGPLQEPLLLQLKVAVPVADGSLSNAIALDPADTVGIDAEQLRPPTDHDTDFPAHVVGGGGFDWWQ